MAQAPGSRLLIIVVRAVLLGLASGSVVMAMLLAGAKKQASAGEQAALGTLCPMHPETRWRWKLATAGSKAALCVF